jgi:hypothetical protein
MRLALGLAALAAWSVLWLLEAHWKALPAYDRPRFTHSPAYAVWAGALRKVLMAVGLILLYAAHRAAAAAAIAALLGAWMVRRIVTGPGAIRRRMQREFDRLKRERPQAADLEILYEIVYAQHRRWGPELVQQIVQDNPTVEGAARMVARLERELSR